MAALRLLVAVLTAFLAEVTCRCHGPRKLYRRQDSQSRGDDCRGFAPAVVPRNISTKDLTALFEAQGKLIDEQAKQIEALLSKQPILDDLSNLKDLATKARRLGYEGPHPSAETHLSAVVQPSAAQRRLTLDTPSPTFGPTGFVTDTVWITASGALVMFMQAGFAVLEAGSVRAKNCGTVLLKNLVDVTLGTLAWYFIGWGIAYGVEDSENPSKVVGSNYFAGHLMTPTNDDDGLIAPPGGKEPFNWFFQWAFCATAATIVSGGVAERIRLFVYILYSVFMTGVIYPFVVYWTWSGAGWLTEEGYSDFAGSGIVHLTGGIAALIGAIMCGVREGRFERPAEFYPHNVAYCVLGTFILWFGWYGFNCGSTLYMKTKGDALSAGLVAINTTMSAAMGGLTVFVVRIIEAKLLGQAELYDVVGMCNGILAGLVAVCAGVGAFEPGVAMVVGMLGALFYEAGHWIMLKAKIDDPLDAFSVHGMAGMAGLIFRPLLCMGGADDKIFKAHIAGLFTIVAWSGGLTALFFLPFKLAGMLAYSEEDQKVGSDVHCSPPKAYSMASVVPVDNSGTIEVGIKDCNVMKGV